MTNPPRPVHVGVNSKSRFNSIPRAVALASLAVISVTSVESQSVHSHAETNQAKIERAMAAGPPAIAKDARIVEMDENGKPNILREGSNGWSCLTGHPGMLGHDSACLDEAAMQWAADLAEHKPKPTNTRPGIVYMLTGGSDWSATDPWARSGTPIKEPPHWAIVWPFDPKESGLSVEPKTTGAWIMYAGTPYAHLMINQKP